MKSRETYDMDKRLIITKKKKKKKKKKKSKNDLHKVIRYLMEGLIEEHTKGNG